MHVDRPVRLFLGTSLKSPGETGQAQHMELEAKKQNKSIPVCAAPRMLVVSGFHFASALRMLKPVGWLLRESKWGAGLTHQTCTVGELRNQKCPGHWSQSHMGADSLCPKVLQTTFVHPGLWDSPRGSQDMAHHHRRAQENTETQRQSLAAGRTKAGSGSRVPRGLPGRAPEAQRLGVHLQLGTRWGWGGSLQSSIKGWKAAEGRRKGGFQLAMKPGLMSRACGQRK